MATSVSITSSYAGEFAGEYISAALLSGKTLSEGSITIKPNVKFKEVVKKVASTDFIANAGCDFTPTADSLTLTERVLEPKEFQVNLELCKKDPSVYASAAERMLLAIGEPELVDTSRNSRTSRIFSNKIIKRYKVFEEFYGMEEAIEQIVSFFKHAAQGLEEKKQILYLLGPVGGGKSSLAEKLKSLML